MRAAGAPFGGSPAHRRSPRICAAPSDRCVALLHCPAMLLARALGGHPAAALLRLLAPSASLQVAGWAQGAALLQQCASYSQPAGGGSGSGAAAAPPSGPLVGFKVTLQIASGCRLGRSLCSGSCFQCPAAIAARAALPAGEPSSLAVPLPSPRTHLAGPGLCPLQVLDVGQVVAGNFAGALLAYFGADVIKASCRIRRILPREHCPLRLLLASHSRAPAAPRAGGAAGEGRRAAPPAHGRCHRHQPVVAQLRERAWRGGLS